MEIHRLASDIDFFFDIFHSKTIEINTCAEIPDTTSGYRNQRQKFKWKGKQFNNFFET